MLRNRSRAVTSKQALMADHSSQPSPTQNYNRRTPSFFGSPKFRAFTKKGLSENDGLISPTSILDTKLFSTFSSTFSSYNQTKPTSPKNFAGNKRSSWDQTEAKGISLVLADPTTKLNDKTNTGDEFSKSCSNRKVLLTTKLRVQIPPLPPSAVASPTDQSPKSPAEFGSKNRNSRVSGCGTENPRSQTKDSPLREIISGGWISVSDVEHSEDYTCVISHGPVPRTTHIFENCIVESYYCLSDHIIHKPNSSPEISNFLSFCCTCKKNLGQKIDIYIYRGEKAFCSRECRYQEMLLDGMGNADLDDAFRNCF